MRIEFDVEIPPGWLAPGEDPSALARVKLVEFLGGRLAKAHVEAIQKAANALCFPEGGASDGNSRSVQHVPEGRLGVSP